MKHVAHKRAIFPLKITNEYDFKVISEVLSSTDDI